MAIYLTGAGMAICTRGSGTRRVWHPSGAGLGAILHPRVHPHPTRGGSGCGCGFQSAPAGARWAPEMFVMCYICHVYYSNPTQNPTRNPWAPEICGHPKLVVELCIIITFCLSKPVGTRNPRVRAWVRVSTRGCGCGCQIPPARFLERVRVLANPPRTRPTAIPK